MKIYWSKTRTVRMGSGQWARELVTDSPRAPFAEELEFWGQQPTAYEASKYKQWWPLSWLRPLYRHWFYYEISEPEPDFAYN